MLQIRKYTPADKAQWDKFVETSRNGTFLFRRDFMDYHADRFADHSLIAEDERGWLAALPANAAGTAFHSHQGLTYGGFVLSPRAGAGCVMALFDAVQDFLRHQGFAVWLYKQVPYIYHRQPSEDEEYALWRIGASLEVCNLAATIDLHSPLLPAQEERRGRGKRRALKAGYRIAPLAGPDDLAAYWPVIDTNLMTCHATRPVHTCAEMQLLMGRFPHNIRAWGATLDGLPAGILLMFDTQMVAHSQYPHATAEGKQQGVMDLLILNALDYYRTERSDLRYFDFGISNEQGGRFLNEGLQAQKEGFGGRGVTYKQWRIPLA